MPPLINVTIRFVSEILLPETSVVSAGGTVLLHPGGAVALQSAGQFPLPGLNEL